MFYKGVWVILVNIFITHQRDESTRGWGGGGYKSLVITETRQWMETEEDKQQTGRWSDRQLNGQTNIVSGRMHREEIKQYWSN